MFAVQTGFLWEAQAAQPPPEAARASATAAAIQTDPRDGAWAAIAGNSPLKRAVLLALSGDHTITVFGHPSNGEEHLRTLLGSLLRFRLPCPCGKVVEPITQVSCTCDPDRMDELYREIRKSGALGSDIIATIVTPTAADRRSTAAEGFEEAMQRVERFRANDPADFPSESASQDVHRMLRDARKRIGFDEADVARAIRLSLTIARFEGAPLVRSSHLQEAIDLLKLPYELGMTYR